MTTSAQVYDAGISPFDSTTPAKRDAGMIAIVEFPGRPKQIGQAVCATKQDDPRILYTLTLRDLQMSFPGYWLLKDGTFIPAD